MILHDFGTMVTLACPHQGMLFNCFSWISKIFNDFAWFWTQCDPGMPSPRHAFLTFFWFSMIFNDLVWFWTHGDPGMPSPRHAFWLFFIDFQWFSMILNDFGPLACPDPGMLGPGLTLGMPWPWHALTCSQSPLLPYHIFFFCEFDMAYHAAPLWRNLLLL